MAMGGSCCIGELRPWRQKLDVASGRRWVGDSIEEIGTGGAAGAQLALGWLRNLSLLQIDEGDELGIGKNEEARARLIAAGREMVVEWSRGAREATGSS
jgi:hypothetical protein